MPQREGEGEEKGLATFAHRFSSHHAFGSSFLHSSVVIFSLPLSLSPLTSPLSTPPTLPDGKGGACVAPSPLLAESAVRPAPQSCGRPKASIGHLPPKRQATAQPHPTRHRTVPKGTSEHDCMCWQGLSPSIHGHHNHQVTPLTSHLRFRDARRRHTSESDSNPCPTIYLLTEGKHGHVNKWASIHA